MNIIPFLETFHDEIELIYLPLYRNKNQMEVKLKDFSILFEILKKCLSVSFSCFELIGFFEQKFFEITPNKIIEFKVDDFKLPENKKENLNQIISRLKEIDFNRSFNYNKNFYWINNKEIKEILTESYPVYFPVKKERTKPLMLSFFDSGFVADGFIHRKSGTYCYDEYIIAEHKLEQKLLKKQDDLSAKATRLSIEYNKLPKLIEKRDQLMKILESLS